MNPNFNKLCRSCKKNVNNMPLGQSLNAQIISIMEHIIKMKKIQLESYHVARKGRLKSLSTHVQTTVKNIIYVLPLDAVCYMLGKSTVHSGICKYF